MSAFFKCKKTDEGVTLVWDPVRQKHVVLTPEEEVRQSILAYMVEQLNYPLKLISVEKQLLIHGRKKRYDIVVYNKNGKAAFLIECKQPKVELKQTTMEQAANYNLQLKVPYLMLTNGSRHFILKVNLADKTFEWLNRLPSLEELEL